MEPSTSPLIARLRSRLGPGRDRHGRPPSLRRRLLTHELTLLLLLLVTATIGGGWLYLWQQFSVENWRLNSMLNDLHRTRSGIYRQIQIVVSSRLSPDRDAADHLETANRKVQDWVKEIRALAHGGKEHAAVMDLGKSWQVIYQDLRQVVENPYAVRPPGRLVLMNTEHARKLMEGLEGAVTRLGNLLSRKRSALEQHMSRYQWWAAWGTPLPLVLAAILVFRSRARVKEEFLRPVAAIREGTRRFSEGDMDHRIEVGGVEEIAELAGAFNAMAEELQQNRQALLERERAAALGSLVPVIGHNIRNPLASIRANAQVLDPEEDAAEIRQARQAILDTTDRLEGWVRSLVTYLHPSKPDLRARPLHEVVAAAAEIARSKARDRDIEIRIAHSLEEDAVDVDAGLMEQALYGLLVNAVEASPRGGNVDVDVVFSDGWPEIRIRDRGPGLPFQPRPTDAGPGPSHKDSGTGLGIPFAFKVAESHGWSLTFETPEDGGTLVRLTVRGGAQSRRPA